MSQNYLVKKKIDGSISYGALEKANKGTLLIDHISEIPLDIQSKILRVLIDQKFKRVNGTNDLKVDVRLICSSNIRFEVMKLNWVILERIFITELVYLRFI